LARQFTLGVLALSAATNTHAQYSPPPSPQPFAGYFNDWLRQQDPYLSAWDLGGNERVRFEAISSPANTCSKLGPLRALALVTLTSVTPNLPSPFNQSIE